MTNLPSSRSRRPLHGYSLVEMLAVVTIIGIVATLIVVRIGGRGASGKLNSCHAIRGNLEIQAQLWYRNKGSWPAANLSDIGADASYLPEGLPSCPVDGSVYMFDSTTQSITGHDH